MSDTYKFRDIQLIKSMLVSSKLQKLMENCSYECEEIDMALAHVQPDDILLELGGGIGAVSAVIMKNKPVAQYVCVEANPDFTVLIKKNHRINGITGVEILSGALTNDSGKTECDFYVTEDFWASSLTRPEEISDVKKVPAHYFNDILKKYRPTFIICDIEGGEFELFEHGADFSSVQKVILEVHNPGSIGPLITLDKFLNSFGLYLQNPPFRPGVLFFKKQNDSICSV